MTSVLDKKKGLDFKNALDHLSEEDEILKKVIKQIKPKEPDRREPNFEALVRIISGQQLSSAAASTIFSRLKLLFKNKEITPSQIKKTKSEIILKCGLSNAKTRYIQNLAELFSENPEFLNELKAKTPPRSQAELGRRIGRTRATVHSAVKVLKDRGLILRERLELAPHLEEFFKLEKSKKTRSIDYEWNDERSRTLVA